MIEYIDESAFEGPCKRFRAVLHPEPKIEARRKYRIEHGPDGWLAICCCGYVKSKSDTWDEALEIVTNMANRRVCEWQDPLSVHSKWSLEVFSAKLP
jgi:hypothetical protein